MKPLSEWTVEELQEGAMDGCDLLPEGMFATKGECLAELLRRERERCARIADEEANESRRHAEQGYPNEADLTAESIAERIRGLQ